jgi:glutamate/tyrosine decarboxylase-like PLP-dependent enzyme
VTHPPFLHARSLGSTYNGQFEDVLGLSHALTAHEAVTGIRVPIHVDAASGGMIAPFAYPELQWDFRVPLVDSINVSGHKYGLVYPGLGWLLFRDAACLPPSLVFKTHYLVRGSCMTLFSRKRILTATVAPPHAHRFPLLRPQGSEQENFTLVRAHACAHQRRSKAA